MYKKIRENQVPKRRRKSDSRFEKTKEWALLKADIDRGLKPQEACEVALTAEEKRRYKIVNRRTIARFVKKYLISKNLTYGVKSFHRDEMDFVIVQHTPVIRNIA